LALGIGLCFLGSAWGAARPLPDGQLPAAPAYGQSKDFFQYINNPKHKVFEWGYRRGDPKTHVREQYLSQVDHTFKAKLKTFDAYGGTQEHYFDINHGPSDYKEPVHHEPAYAPPAPAYSAGSEPEGTYVAAPGDARNKRSLPYPEVYYILA